MYLARFPRIQLAHLPTPFEHLARFSKEPGGPATARLYFNAEKVGEAKIEKQVRGRFSTESLDIGMNTLSSVSIAYHDKLPFAFTGKINFVKIDFEDDGTEISAKEKAEMKKAMD